MIFAPSPCGLNLTSFDTRKEGSKPIDIVLPGRRTFKLYSQAKFSSAMSKEAMKSVVEFHSLIRDIMEQVLGRSFSSLRFCMVSTMRSDASVCSYSKADKLLWVNALVFLQSNHLEEGSNEGDMKRQRRRQALYWTQRLAMAFSEKDQSEGSEKKPTGVSLGV